MNIILASGSPRRRELLKLICDDFDVITADVDETVSCGMNVYDVPQYLAELKCGAVAKEHKDCMVIGADTVVICGNEIFGKPRDDKDAENMLKRLSGASHDVVTGCCIMMNGKTVKFSEKTQVFFRDLTDDEIKKYVESGEPSDKAGAYGIQGKGALLVEKIYGDFFNVVGLPISKLNEKINFEFNK